MHTVQFPITNSIGRLSWTCLENGNSCITMSAFSYDAMGNRVLDRQGTPQQPNGFPFNYGYDGVDDVTSSSNGNGISYTLTYGGTASFTAPRLTQIATNWLSPTISSGNLISNVQYNAFAEPSSANLYNGISESWGYDTRGRMQSYTAGTKYTLSNITYSGNSNVLSATDSVNGTWAAYKYDDFNRLGSSSCTAGCPGAGNQNGLAFSYVYDRYGNRWQQNMTLGSIGPQPQYAFDANNRIIGVTFDAVGNLINDGTHGYTYDAENRIVKVDAGGTGLYTYDAEGRRVAKTAGGASYEYLFDLGGRAVTELISGTTNTNRTETYAGGRHLATQNVGLGSTYFIHSDGLGTERVRTGLTGSSIETCTSLAYGDALTCAGTDVSPLHFTGKERDTESGLDNFGARYNASSMGRFMTPDPSPNGIAPGDPQSWNLYSYVRNRPTRSVDVGGNWATDVHAEMVTVALQGLVSAGELKQLVAEQYVMDKNQAPEFQYRHAMSNGQSTPPESTQDASNKMWDFVATMMGGANATLGPNGQFNSTSLANLGDAIHTVEDYTSPMHTSPSGEPLPWYGAAHGGFQHWQGENSPSDSWAGFGQAIRLTMAAFMQANPELAKRNGLTEANFNAEADRRISQYVENFFRMSGNVMGTDHMEEEAARLCALGNPAACD